MCDFQIPFTDSAESLVDKANKAITGIGGTFTGDTSTGQFSLSTPVGKISGTYTVGDKVLHVAIDDKPFFIPCSQIESQLKKSLEGA
jgi:uncharacterized protein (DUF779 family)